MTQIRTSRICTLMVTHACNLRCIYCFEKFKSHDPAKRMSFDVARTILEREIAHFASTYPGEERFAVEFFGGEPLLNFPLVEQVYVWMKGLSLSFPYVFQITTNGTLLDEPIREWLTQRRDDFRIVLSVDGTEMMQEHNRGCGLGKIPIAFVRDTWPKSYFKMTLSRETLSHYADGIISLSENGYRIASSLAEGVEWMPGDEAVYRAELEKVGRFYIEHPDLAPEHPFNYIYKEVLDENRPVQKNCGVGTSIATYDIDGKCYPCHLFLPIVHGREDCYEAIHGIDFSDDSRLVSLKCQICPLLRLCRTCYGYNYLLRGDIAARNLSGCRMQLVEAQVVSAFEIKWLTQRQRVVPLTEDELLMLKAAVLCYEKTKLLEPSDF